MRIKLDGCLGIVLLAIALASLGQADEPAPADRIDQLIERLNADRFGARQQAHAELLKAGEKILPQLRQAADVIAAEQRYRVSELIREIRVKALEQRFAKIIGQDDAAINLDEGMMLIAQIVDPMLDRQAIARQLDDLAAAVHKRLGADAVPKHAAPQDFVDALIVVLRDDFKLLGNIVDYNNPDNSSLPRVLKTRQGLPILLSHVAVSVAERLEVPIVGLSIPGRYMIKYEGSRAPLGYPREDIIIDPFGNWQILTPADVKKMIRAFDPERHLVPSSRRASLARMLRNLVSDFLGAGEIEKAADAEHIALMLERIR